MNAQSFLQQALQRDILLSVHGDELNVDAPNDALTSDVLECMRQHKTEIIEILRMPSPHGSCHQCGETTQAMLTRPDGSCDWMCEPCFDQEADPA